MNDLLDDTMRESHRTLREELEASATAARGDAKCGEILQKTDALLIDLCRHVSAVCDVVLPSVGREVPNGSRLVRAYVRQAKDLERAAARTKGRLYGASGDARVPWQQVWADLDTEFDRLLVIETELTVAMAGATSPESSRALAARLRATQLTGPTRPHPNSPHTGRFAHLVRRIWIMADRAWDSAEARIVPGAVRAVKRVPRVAPEKA